MRQREHHRHPVNAFEDVGALRRAVARLTGAQAGLRDGEAELVATELGTNLLRHANPGGYVLYRLTGDGIEFLSVDTGPGMAMPPTSGVRDPVAPGTGAQDPVVFGKGGLSAGLAGIRRMAREFDYYSNPAGTVLLARLGGAGSDGNPRWRYGAVNVPLGDAGLSGDAWAVTDDARLAALLVDGLGHGDAAAAAAQAAVTTFNQRPLTDPEEFLRQAHDAMRGTRGAVAAVCLIDQQDDRLTNAGVGNIAEQVVNGHHRQHLVSHPGTLGTYFPAPRVRVQHYRWPPGATLVMTSDGIRSGWNLSAYPGLLLHDPAVIAAVLHRDFARGTDDACVLVVRDMR